MIEALRESRGGDDEGPARVASPPIQCLRFFLLRPTLRRVYFAAQLLGQRACLVSRSDEQDDLVAMLVDEASFGPGSVRFGCCLLQDITCAAIDREDHIDDVWPIARGLDGHWMVEVVPLFELRHHGWREGCCQMYKLRPQAGDHGEVDDTFLGSLPR